MFYNDQFVRGCEGSLVRFNISTGSCCEGGGRDHVTVTTHGMGLSHLTRDHLDAEGWAACNHAAAISNLPLQLLLSTCDES